MNTKTTSVAENAQHHTASIKRMLHAVAQHAREDVEKVVEPKAQALRVAAE